LNQLRLLIQETFKLAQRKKKEKIIVLNN
jgi:hypothetical protein